MTSFILIERADRARGRALRPTYGFTVWCWARAIRSTYCTVYVLVLSILSHYDRNDSQMSCADGKKDNRI